MTKQAFTWDDDASDNPIVPKAFAWGDDVSDEQVRPKFTMAESAGMGALQGATLDFADEIGGAGKTAYQVLAGRTGGKEPADLYRDTRDALRGKFKEAQEDNPGSYTTGQVGGGLATAAVPGLGVLNAAKGANAVRIVGQGALAGGLSGLGASEGDLTKPDDVNLTKALDDTVTGAATGGLVAGAVGALGSAANKLAPFAKSGAERSAFKAAVGNQGKAYDTAVRQGRVNTVGRDLLDDEMVTFGSKARGISEKAEVARKAAGEKIGGLLGEIDQAAPNSVSGEAIAAKIRAYASKIKSPANAGIVDKLNSQADEFAGMGNMPLQEAQRIKNLYKWDSRDPAAMPIGKEATNEIKAILGGEMDDAVGRYSASSQSVPAEQFSEVTRTASGRNIAVPPPNLMPALGEVTQSPNPKAAELYEQLKGKYGNAAFAKQMSEKLANRFEKNNALSLTDLIVGGAGGLGTLNPGTGLAMATGSKIARERGRSAMAVTLDKASQMLGQNPEKLGRFGKLLRDAATRGNTSLAVTHQMLMNRDPEYRQIIESQE